MKKIFLIGALCILMSSLLAVSAQLHEPGSGMASPELMQSGQAAMQGAAQGINATGAVPIAIVQQRIMARAGEYLNSEGKQIRIQRQANNMCTFEVGGVNATCPLNMTQEQFQNRTRLYVGLSNGRNAEIKVMPDTASEVALQRLRLKNCDGNCSVQLREVGSGNQTKMVYKTKVQRTSRVLGLFRARMNVQAQVDAETGDVVSVNKPWWAFLATEPEE